MQAQSFKERLPALIATAVSGALDGASDGFEYHSDNLGASYWNGKYAWLNKYKNRDPRQGPAFFGSTTFLAGVTSGDHLMQSLSNFSGSIAIALAPGRKDRRFWPTVLEIAIYQAAYNLPRAFVLETFFKPRIQ